MDIKKIISKAKLIRKKYSELENKKYNRSWNNVEIMQGFVGDMGDLSKLIMAKEGVRKINNVDKKLEHELAYCLFSIIILADAYNINIEKAFSKTMNDLEKKIKIESKINMSS